ncbi:MAG: hypothetical protein RRY11_04945 [Terrisporobacter sp.]
MNNTKILNKDSSSMNFNTDDIIDIFMSRSFDKKTSAKITLILYVSPTLLEAQDMMLIEFKGDFEVINKCMDIIENYYNSIECNNEGEED